MYDPATKPLSIPQWLSVEWGEPVFNNIRAQIKDCVERETGRPHAWELAHDIRVWELRPEGDNRWPAPILYADKLEIINGRLA